jgi:ornithine cyclodeaminase/alanine dehydrogenase-like protein (mu-crystallin family)
MNHPLPYLDAASLRQALDYPSAVSALRAAYEGRFRVPARLQMDAGEPGHDGRMWLMPAQAGGVLGVKLVTQFDGNTSRGLDRIQGVYIYLDAETGRPLALMDGRAITEIRTAAISALATTLLANRQIAARREAEGAVLEWNPMTLAIFGCGVQGAAHLAAMRSLFRIREALVCGSTLAKTQAFAEAHSCRAASAEECARADLICACTTSRTPVFDGSLLRPGTHINAVGNSRPDGRELDSATVQRARVAVDTREGALAEAGDLLQPLSRGEIAEAHILADLQELVRGEKTVRRDAADITLFKSVGFALGDLALARLAYQSSCG